MLTILLGAAGALSSPTYAAIGVAWVVLGLWAILAGVTARDQATA